MTFQFKIEQVAISVNPHKRKEAFALLSDLGFKSWAEDLVVARGSVGSQENLTNVGELAFNYEAGDIGGKPVEFEVLHYASGDNFVDRAKEANSTQAIATHIGMHCSAVELEQVEAIFKKHNIRTSQCVNTLSHTNPHIRDSRRYTYKIFYTRPLLGIDLKFIVRREIPKKA